MQTQTPLERRYRRWLAVYPPAFRARHEDEMLSVLLHGARDGQRHPRLVDIADLAWHGLRQRGSERGFPSRWERSHARFMFPFRIAVAAWLCFISSLLIAYHRGEGWLVVLLPAIALHLYLAYRIRPAARHH